MSSIRKCSLGEKKRFSNRNQPESQTLPSFNRKTVMQSMVIFFFSLAGNKTVSFCLFVSFQKQLAECMYYSCWNHTLLIVYVL